MFEDAYPEFISKHVLKAEQFLLLRDFPRELAALVYADFSDGILFGCRVVAGEGAVRVMPGVLLRGGVFYKMTKPFILPHAPGDAVQYVNALFSDGARTEEDITARRGGPALCDSPAGEEGIELSRFKLKTGARLRDDYTDFDDLDTEYDTLNPTYAPCASKGGATLLPHVTERFAKEALSYGPKDPADVCFAMLCLFGDRVPLSPLQSYLETKGGLLRLHLDIDEEQDREKARFFPWSPITGNPMYAMPIVGTKARLCFPDGFEENAFAGDCVRENGDVCPETADPDTRYFRTEHGKELMMSPTKLHFKDMNAATGGKLFLELDDDFGIRLSSHGDINIASGSVSVKAEGKVSFSAPSRIRFNQMSKGSKGRPSSVESMLSFENEVHLLAGEIEYRGRSSVAYPPLAGEQAAKPAAKPPAVSNQTPAVERNRRSKTRTKHSVFSGKRIRTDSGGNANTCNQTAMCTTKSQSR